MRKDAVTVPQRVVMQGANGAYAYVIKPDNTAERRVIEIEFDAGRLHRHQQGHRRRRESRARRPVPPVQRQPGAHRPADPSPRGFRPQELTPAMNVSETYIRRPIATSLMMLGLLVFGAATYTLLPVSALPNVDFPTITVSATPAGRQPGDHGLLGRHPARAAVRRHPRPRLDELDQRARRDRDHPAVRPQPQHRRRRHRRADGDQRGERSPAQGPADAADLPQGQPGRPCRADLRRSRPTTCRCTRSTTTPS